MKSLIISKNKIRGFTLIEILIVIALIGFIISLGNVVNIDFYSREVRLSEQATLISILQKARSDAMNNIHTTSHGVHIDNDTYTFFEGTNYNSNESTNQAIKRNPNITISGLENIVFEQLSGNTENTGTIILEDTNNIEKFINIKANGLIDW